MIYYKKKKKKFFTYLDINNLYGRAISEYIPMDEFYSLTY